MKKISVFMAVVLIIVLSVPSVPVQAAVSFLPGVYTQESVDGIYSGLFNGSIDRAVVASEIYSFENNNTDYDLLSGFSSVDFSVYTNPISYFLFYKDGSFFLFILEHDSDNPYLPLLIKDPNGYFSVEYPIVNNSGYKYLDYYVLNSSTLSQVQTYRTNRFVQTSGITCAYFDIAIPPYDLVGTGSSVCYCSNILGIYDLAEGVSLYPQYTGDNRYANMLNLIYEGDTSFTNYWFSSLPYWNGTNIVDPDDSGSEVESNENHMYFNSCEIGFVEPSGVNSYNSFGGAYFYIKYSVDDWVKTHINDYDLYFSSTALVGNRQVNGSKRVSLDSDGCICIPFSDIFTGNSSLLSEGFVVATSNSRVEQNFYKSYLYSVSSQKLPSLVGKFSSVDNNTLSGAWDKLLDVYYGNWLLAYTSTGFTQVITDTTMAAIQSVINYYANFKIQTQCYLIDNNDNRSGSVGRLFDLATGSDTSTDNEGLTNDNPFVDDSTTDDYLPDIPTDNNNYPVSTGQNGTYIQNNLSVPSEYTVTYRDGVNDFIDWYNQDSEVSGIQNTVWGSFGIFRDNPAIDLYEEYFGFLPAPFKAVILGCGTIGIVGGAACVLRKRLMK